EAWCWDLYARALSAEKLHDRALEAARRALDLQPGPAGLVTLVHVLAATGKHEAIVEQAGKHAEIFEHSAELWLQLGYSLNALGRSDEAVEAFRRAEALEPGRDDTSCGLAH